MRTLLFISLLMLAACAYAGDYGYGPALDQVGQVDMQNAPQRIMPLYEQGWNEGAKVGDSKSGKIGWFGLGLVGNIPFMWLPWVVNPRRPAKPPIQAEEEFNSGWKNGYRAGWKNAHKGFYIAGAIVSTAAVATVVATQE
jgi:hypothetical protein